MSTTTLPVPLPSIEVLACGDPATGHRPGCLLDTAEQISTLAINVATADGRNPIIAALAALDEAGMVGAVDTGTAEQIMYAVLDDLWQDGLLGPAGGQS